MGVDQGKDALDQLGRQIVPHPFDDLESRAIDVACHVAAAGHGQQRIGGAVDDEGRRRDRRQQRAAVAGGKQRQHLARTAAWAIAAPHGARDALAQLPLRGRIGWAAEQSQQPDGVLDDAVEIGGVGGMAGQRLAHRRARPRQAAPAAGGHDRGQAQHPLRVARRQLLGDHAAQRRHADQVGPGHAQRRQHAEGVGRHVLDAIGRAQRPAQGGLDARQREVRPAGLLEPGRQATVAVVEADHVKAELDKAFDEVVGPVGQLHAEAVDQEQRRGFGVARGVEGDAQSVGVEGRHEQIAI